MTSQHVTAKKKTAWADLFEANILAKKISFVLIPPSSDVWH